MFDAIPPGGMVAGLALVAFGGWSLTFYFVRLFYKGEVVQRADVDKAEKRADKWEGIALTAMGVAEKLTVHAEVTTEVLTRLPDPAEERETS